STSTREGQCTRSHHSGRGIENASHACLLLRRNAAGFLSPGRMYVRPGGLPCPYRYGPVHSAIHPARKTPECPIRRAQRPAHDAARLLSLGGGPGAGVLADMAGAGTFTCRRRGPARLAVPGSAAGLPAVSAPDLSVSMLTRRP